MTITFADLLALARDSVGDPRGSLRQILRLPIGLSDRWAALAATVAVSVVLAQGTALLFGPASSGDPAVDMFLNSPIRLAIAQFILLSVIVVLVCTLGRARGGTATLSDTVLAMAWLQFIMVCLQVLQTLILLVLPSAAGLVGLVSLVLFLWLFSSFVSEVHGFRSTALTFLAILGAFIVLAFAISLILALAGVSVPGT